MKHNFISNRINESNISTIEVTTKARELKALGKT